MKKPTGIEAEVCSDIAERQRKGIAKYGTTVADNPLKLKAWLQHAYEETLDKAIYLKRAIAECDSKQPAKPSTRKKKEWPKWFTWNLGSYLWVFRSEKDGTFYDQNGKTPAANKFSRMTTENGYSQITSRQAAAIRRGWRKGK